MSGSTHKQEARILAALVANLGAAGFVPAAVWIEGGDGGSGYVMAPADGAPTEAQGPTPDTIHRPLTLAEVQKVFEDYDLYVPTVHFTGQHVTTWGNHGVAVVPGNGSDFISDYHAGDAAFTAIVDEVSDAAAAEVYA